MQSKFPWIAEQVNNKLNQPSVSKVLFRVRKTWADATSQIGAYSDINNARRACDKAGGAYYVFDAQGNVVYPLSFYQVKVVVDALNIRSGPGTDYKIVGCIKDGGVYTITKTVNGWGKLKSGAGYICLSYTEKI